MIRTPAIASLIVMLPILLLGTPNEEPRDLGPVFVTEPLATFAGPVELSSPPVPVDKPRADFEVLNNRETHPPQTSVTYPLSHISGKAMACWPHIKGMHFRTGDATLCASKRLPFAS